MNPQDQQPTPPEKFQGSIYAPPQPLPPPIPVAPKESPALGVAAVALAIVVAPIGFVVGIASLVKGVRTHTASLTVLGLIASIISVIVTIVVAIYVVLPAFQRANSEGFTKLSEQSVKLGSATVTSQVPGSYQEVQTDEEAKTSVIWSDPASEGQVRVISKEENITADEMVDLVVGIEDNTNGLRDTMRAGYETDLSEICTDPKIGNIESVEVDGALAAYRTSFACISEDGEALQGVVTDALTGQNTATQIILLPKQEWQAGQANVKTILQSFSIAE